MVDWSSHPVDVLADLCPDADPERLAELRAICDQPVSVALVSMTFEASDFGSVPSDYAAPDWASASRARRAHEWKNYISDKLREMWPTFTDEQKRVIAESANDSASNEDWD